MKCGGSDGFSGLSANPALGHAADLLVAQGGTVVITEVPEFCGAEHILAQRAKDRPTGEAVYQMVDWYKDYASKFGTVLGENPSPGNVAGGLLNITIKSLGAIAKAGTTRVEGVTGYADVPKGRGLWLMQGPGYDQESTPGLVGAGSQVVVFTTGRGTTIGNAIAPIVKLDVEHARLRADVARHGPVGRRDHRRHRDDRAGRRPRVRSRDPRRLGRGARARGGDQAPRVRDLGRAVGVALIGAAAAGCRCVANRPTEATSTMKAAVLSAVGRIEIRDVPVRPPGRGDVLLGPASSDSAAPTSTSSKGTATTTPTRAASASRSRSSRRCSATRSSPPSSSAAPASTDLRVGDDVVVDQGINCLSAAREPRCEYCATGDSHQCASYREHGITGLPGGLAEFLTMPAVNAIAVGRRRRRATTRR